MLCSLSASPVRAEVATFSKGSVSIGVGGGLALISLREVNDFLTFLDLNEGRQWDEFDTAPEVTGDVRYAINDKILLGIEGGYFQTSVKDHTMSDPGGVYELTASGVPLVLIGGYSTNPDNNFVFRILGGLGALINGKLKNNLGTESSGTGAIVQIGGEVEWRALSQMGIAFEGLARSAKVVEPDDSPNDLDFSGGSFRMMLRGYFGGKKP